MTSNFTAFLRPFRAACLFVLLTVCCGGCSDSGSVDETPPADQLALSPSSLVFDEQDPAKNEFTVTVTDGLTWVLQVKPSAAGCKFSASSGRGSGSFRVEQMPDDSSIEIEAVHTYNNGTQLKSNSVRITRGKAVLEPTLELAPEKLTFDPDDASANIKAALHLRQHNGETALARIPLHGGIARPAGAVVRQAMQKVKRFDLGKLALIGQYHVHRRRHAQRFRGDLAMKKCHAQPSSAAATRPFARVSSVSAPVLSTPSSSMTMAVLQA